MLSSNPCQNSSKHFITYSLTSKNIWIIIYELILRGYHENAINGAAVIVGMMRLHTRVLLQQGF